MESQAGEGDEERRLDDEPPEALAVRMEKRQPPRLRDRLLHITRFWWSKTKGGAGDLLSTAVLIAGSPALALLDAVKTTPGAKRPLCLYPLWPRYDGKGDPKSAASFACAR